jgi:pantoate kinase
LPIPSLATGVHLTLPAGIGHGEPGASSLKTALAGGVVLDVSFGDDDEDDYEDDYDDDEDDDDWIF